MVSQTDARRALTFLFWRIVKAARKPFGSSRPQYSLRAVMCAVGIIAIWLGVATNRARVQAEVASAVRSIGGNCYYSHQYSRHDGLTFGDIEPTAAAKWPAAMQRVLGIDFLEGIAVIKLHGSVPNYDCCEKMAGISTLQEIHIIKPELMEADVTALRCLTNVRVLFLQLELPPSHELLNELTTSLPRCEIVPFLVRGS